MLSPDSSHRSVSGNREEIDELLAALPAGGRPFLATALPEDLMQDLAEVLAGAGGEVEVTLSGPHDLSVHGLTLARAGTLRRSRGLTGPEDLTLHPTSTLPGVLLRLAGIAPVEELSPDVGLAPAHSDLEDLFAEETALRTAAWARMLEVGAALPDAAQGELEQAPPRAVRLVRRRASGDRNAVVLLLRGRYLLAEPHGTMSLRGTTPTGASRALLRPLLSENG